MTLKHFYMGLAAAIYAIVVFGIVAPMLISAASTTAFLIGVVLIVGPVIAGIHYYLKKKKSTDSAE